MNIDKKVNRGTNTQKDVPPRSTNTSSTYSSNSTKTDGKKDGKGLNVDIHPLLNPIVHVPQLPKNFNPLKRKNVDTTTYNPYIDGSGPKRKHRALTLVPQGKYIQEGEKLRDELRKEAEKQKIRQELESKGLVADEELGEHLYKQEPPPELEWWDAFYVEGSYDGKVVLDNEQAPVSSYIQHPVHLSPLFDKFTPEQKSMYLTKKEMKRKRKNERQERFKLQQERIRKGLEPPPPPKVKLSNLMSVLTNEAIKDPTSVEKRVKKEVQERYNKHMQQNEQRKLSKEQRIEKHHQKIEADKSKGYFRSVYRINQLIDGQHFFKVDKTAQQLELTGLCVNTDQMTIIVVEGGSKAVNFYDKLVLKRIDWTKSNNPDLNLAANKVFKVWEGPIKELKFQKWSVLKPKVKPDLTSVLERFDILNYWRQAVGLQEE